MRKKIAPLGGDRGGRKVKPEIFRNDLPNTKNRAASPSLSKPGQPVPLVPSRGVKHLQVFGDGSERRYGFKPDQIETLVVQELRGFERTWTSNRGPAVSARPPGDGWAPEATNDVMTSWLRRRP